MFLLHGTSYWRIHTRRFVGGQSHRRFAKRVFACSITPDPLWHFLGITQKWLPLVGQESSCFYCWNYAIFQEIATVWKRFITHKTFEVGQKRRASFSTSCAVNTNAVGVSTVQNAFERYILQTRACCSLVFDTVLAILSEIGKNSIWKVFPTWSEVEQLISH